MPPNSPADPTPDGLDRTDTPATSPEALERKEKAKLLSDELASQTKSGDPTDYDWTGAAAEDSRAEDRKHIRDVVPVKARHVPIEQPKVVVSEEARDPRRRAPTSLSFARGGSGEGLRTLGEVEIIDEPSDASASGSASANGSASGSAGAGASASGSAGARAGASASGSASAAAGASGSASGRAGVSAPPASAWSAHASSDIPADALPSSMRPRAPASVDLVAQAPKRGRLPLVLVALLGIAAVAAAAVVITRGGASEAGRGARASATGGATTTRATDAMSGANAGTGAGAASGGASANASAANASASASSSVSAEASSAAGGATESAEASASSTDASAEESGTAAPSAGGNPTRTAPPPVRTATTRTSTTTSARPPATTASAKSTVTWIEVH